MEHNQDEIVPAADGHILESWFGERSEDMMVMVEQTTRTVDSVFPAQPLPARPLSDLHAFHFILVTLSSCTCHP